MNTHLHSEWIIVVPELLKNLASVTLVDVREPEEVAVSTIKDSRHIPLRELHLRAEEELDKNADIVIFCAHGIRSLHALALLEKLGFKKLRSLDGGIAAWNEYHGLTNSLD